MNTTPGWPGHAGYLQFISGGGEMGRLVKTHNWASSSLGMPSTWPQNLHTSLGILLNSKFPMFLFWGPDLICFYNDAFRPSLGNDGKHPDMLGMRGEIAWPEIWHIIKPLIDEVLDGGSVWYEDMLVPIFRNGKIEDVYWTFSYSPVLDESGRPAGVFVTCVETTKNVKKQIEESERNFKNTILQSPVAMALLKGPHHVLEIINASMLELIGRQLEEVINRPIFESIPEGVQQGFKDYFDSVYNTGKGLAFKGIPVTLIRNGKEETFYCDVRYEPYRDEHNDVTGIISIAVDVTEQVAARKKIEESQKQLQFSLGAGRLGAWRLDLKTMQLDASPLCKANFGLQPGDDFNYNTLISIIHPDDREQMQEAVAKAIASGNEYNIEYRVLYPDKGVHWVNVSGQVYAESGIPEYMVGVSTDITERKNTEEQLKETRALLETTLQNVPTAVYHYDKNGHIIYINDVAVQQMGFSSAEEILNEKDLDRLRHTLEQRFDIFDEKGVLVGLEHSCSAVTFATGKPAQDTIRFVNKQTGHSFWLLTKSVPLFNEQGELANVFSACTDVTEIKEAEEKIKASELAYQNIATHLSLATDSAGVGTWSFDVVTKKIEWSSLHKRMWGYSESMNDLTYEDWHQLILPGDQEEAFERVARAWTGDGKYEATYRIKRADDGEIRWIISNGLYHYNEAGEAHTLTGISRDITAQKDAEALLKKLYDEAAKQQIIYEAVTNNTPDLIYLFDLQYRFTYANKALLAMWGITAEEAYLKSLRELGYQEWHAALHEKEIDEVIATKQPIRGTVSFPHAELGLRIYDYILTPVLNENDEVIAIAGTTRDITDIKQSEEKLSQSETRFRLLAESVPQMIWMTDEKGQREYISKQWTRYSGLDPEKDRNFWQLMVHPEDYQNIMTTWGSSLQTGEPYSFEARLKNKHGDYRWHMGEGTPLKNNEGKILKWIGALTDIHEQKTREQKKDEFISIASHEMRTPLTSAKGYLELLLLTINTDATEHLYAHKAMQSLERLQYFVTDLLDASKIQNGKLDYNIGQFNFNELVDDVAESIQLISKTHRIQKNGTGPGIINGDRDRLRQVLVNLLTNAIKYSPGADTVIVSISEKDDSVQVAIQDFGVGIPQQHLDRIFERYYRVQDHARTFKGLGIGLYISHDIVKRHHGNMWVESEPGKGSIFYFTLPL